MNQQIVLQAADPNPSEPTPWYNFTGGAANQGSAGVPPGGGSPTWTTWTLAPGNSFVGQASTATMYTVIQGNIILFGGGTTGSPGAIPRMVISSRSSTSLHRPRPTTGLVPAPQRFVHTGRNHRHLWGHTVTDLHSLQQSGGRWQRGHLRQRRPGTTTLDLFPRASWMPSPTTRPTP